MDSQTAFFYRSCEMVGFPNCIFYNTFLAGIDAHGCPRFPKLYFLQHFSRGQRCPWMPKASQTVLFTMILWRAVHATKVLQKYSLGIRCPILGTGFPNCIFCKHSGLGGFPNCIFYKYSCAVGCSHRMFYNTFDSDLDPSGWAREVCGSILNEKP